MADSGEVQLHFLDYWRVIKNRWGIITLTFLLVMVTAYITSYFLPREYTSRVTIEVKSDDYQLHIFDGSGGLHDNPDSRFVPTQFAILKSKEILYPVIDELGLVDKWSIGLPYKLSKQRVYDMLVGMLKNLRDIRNTNLLEIIVDSTDPQEAANIANTVAVQYLKRRRDDQQTLIGNGLMELQEEVSKQSKKVEAAEAEEARIRDRDHLIDVQPDTNETAELQETGELQTTRTKMQEASAQVEQLKTQLAQIDKMTPNELINGLAMLNISDPTVSKILPLYQDAIASEVGLINSGIGNKHPRLMSLRAQKDVYRKQLDAQIESLRKSLVTRLTIAQNFLATCTANYNDAKQKFTSVKNLSADYVSAKNRYIQEKKILETAQNRYETQKMELGISFTPAKIWEKAEPAFGPSSPNVTILMMTAFAVGVCFGVGLAFFLEYLDTSVKTLADVEKFIGVSVLAVVPKIGGLLHKMEGRSPDAETYRTLRTNIDFHKPAPDANTMTVISGGPGEGKSTTLCNLAVICANAGGNVLIIDADLRRPAQHKFFDMDGSVGLVNYVNGEMEMEDVIKPTSVDNLWLIPSGPLPKDPVAILNSHRVVELIGRAKTQYDLVLFDSPPILGLSDGAVLSSVVEMTVMVVQHRRFPRASLLRVKQAVLNVGGNLTGVVLNRVDTRDDQNYYYYTSYYDYYAPTEQRKKPSEEAEI